jgi:hypothetical protein
MKSTSQGDNSPRTQTEPILDKRDAAKNGINVIHKGDVGQVIHRGDVGQVIHRGDVGQVLKKAKSASVQS